MMYKVLRRGRTSNTFILLHKRQHMLSLYDGRSQGGQELAHDHPPPPLLKNMFKKFLIWRPFCYFFFFLKELFLHMEALSLLFFSLWGLLSPCRGLFLHVGGFFLHGKPFSPWRGLFLHGGGFFLWEAFFVIVGAAFLAPPPPPPTLR